MHWTLGLERSGFETWLGQCAGHNTLFLQCLSPPSMSTRGDKANCQGVPEILGGNLAME